MAKALEQNAGGVFDLRTVDSRDDAVNQIRTRDAYGAVILGRQPEVLDRRANGAALNRILKGVSQQLRGQLAQAAFPLTMGGMLGGGVITLCMQAMYGMLQGNPLLNVLAAGLVLLVANPISGASAPSQFLP